MKLMMDDFKKMSINDIYLKIESTLDILYLEYDYIMDKDEFEDLVVKTIKAIKKIDFINNVDVLPKIKDYLKIKIEEMLKEIFDNNLIEVMNKVIDIKLNDTSDYHNALIEIEKLSILSLYNINLSFDDCMELINNNSKLNNLLSIVVNNNKKLLTSKGAEAISNSEFIISLIESYCILNQFDKEIEDDNEVTHGLNDNIKIYLNELRKYPLLSLEEEKEISLKVLKGDKKARQLLINHNLRLVVNIAKRYVGRGLSFGDLIQEGNLGLMKAVDKYDVTKGYRFSTYATWWIKQSMGRAINDSSRNIRIPVATQELLSKLNKAIVYLESVLDRAPTDVEVAEYLKLPLEKIIELLNIKSDTVSLNSLIGEDGDSELGDFLPSDENIVESIEQKMFPLEVQEALKSANLTERELKIIELRYGLGGNSPETLEQIGDKLDITRERVRQVESKALRKLSKSKKIEILYNSLSGKDEKVNITENSNKLDKPVVKSIYETFKPYTREQVDNMINHLSPYEQNVLHLKFGYNFNFPKQNYLWNEYLESDYINIILPKIRRILKELEMVEKINAQKNFSVSEFLTHSVRVKIAYETNPFTENERLCFNYLVNDVNFKKILKEYSDVYTRVVYYRLGIGRKDCMSLNVLTTLVPLQKYEISYFFMELFNKYDKYILEHNKKVKQLKKEF